MAEVKIALNVNSEEGTQKVSAFNQHIVSAMDQIKVAGADTSTTVANAFRQLSDKSIQALEDEKSRVISAYESIANSAITSYTDVQAAKERMAERIIEIEDEITSHSIDASAAIGDSFQQVNVKSDALTKQWRKLYNVSEILLSGIKKLHNIISGILWGAVIGAVSAVVTKLINYVTQAWRAEEASSQLADAVRKQAEEWQLLPVKLKDVTEATVGLYNAQLRQAQFLERNEGGRLQQQIKDLTSLNDQLQRNIGGLEKYTGALDESAPFAGKLLDDLKGRILRNNVAIAEAIKRQEDWQSLMSMSPATFSAVAANVSGVTKKIDDLNISLKTQIEDLDMQIIKLRDGEAAYTEAIRARQIAQGADVALVDLLIGKQKELNDLKNQGELDKLIAETQKKQIKWKPIVDIPTAPAFAPGERDVIKAISDKHDNAIKGMEEEQQMVDALMGSYGELAQQQVVQIEVSTALAQIKQAMVGALAQEILGQHNYAKALKNATAQVLAAKASEAAVEALWETAKGFAALYTNPPAAADHFKSAAVFAATAVLAGGTAQALYSPPSQKEQQSRKELEATQPPANIKTSQTTQPQPQIINMYFKGDLVSYDEIARKLRPHQLELGRDTI